MYIKQEIYQKLVKFFQDSKFYKRYLLFQSIRENDLKKFKIQMIVNLSK